MERRKVFTHLSAENDHSHCAVLTASVRAICRSLTNEGKASFNKQTSRSASFMLSNSLFCKVHLASVHSIVTRSLFKQLYDSINGSRQSISRNCEDEGLQHCIALIRSRYLLSNLF